MAHEIEDFIDFVRNLFAKPPVPAPKRTLTGAKLPQMKGALGREKMESAILDHLKRIGRTKGEIKFIKDTMMNADLPQLQRILNKLISGGK